MEGGRFIDMILGEKNHRCCGGEGSLDPGERREGDKQRESSTQGTAQEKHFPKTADREN